MQKEYELCGKVKYRYPSNAATDGKMTSDTENGEKYCEVEPSKEQFCSTEKTRKNLALLAQQV